MSYLYEVVGTDGRANFAWPRSAAQRQRLHQELLALMGPAVSAAKALARIDAPFDLATEVDRFLALYPDRPLPDNKGGSGLNDSLWLYTLVRLLRPSLIVESGTWRGQSAWLLRQADPDAEIHSFDVERPEGAWHETPGVTFHLRDWTEIEIEVPQDGHGLAFFDDHISHARRLVEAAERGFRLALLDDNFPAERLHATGAPPVPTLAMLDDEISEQGRVIEWQRNGKIYRYHDLAARRLEAQGLVQAQLTLPDLAPATRHPPGSCLTMVRLAGAGEHGTEG